MRRRNEPHLPSHAVAVVFERMAAQEQVELNVICERAGTSVRTWNFYAKGGRWELSFTAADKVLTFLGLAWWQVWNERTVRRPVLVVEDYRPYVKQSRKGVPTRYWDHGRQFYGDAGPDHDALAAIEHIFWGEREEAA